MKKTTIRFLILAGLLVLVALFFTTIFTEHSIYDEEVYDEHGEYEEESEEEIAFETALKEDDFEKVPSFNPSELKGRALVDYRTWIEELERTNNTFTLYNTSIAEKNSIEKFQTLKMPPTEYTYANNAITGIWEQKSILTNGWRNNNNGFRSDGSTYDPVNKELYVVSYAGHLYKIDESENINWGLRNHKKNFKGEDFNGINLPSGAFRLLNQMNNGGMEFSDDEGRTWTTANGALFQNSWNFKTLVTKTPSGRRVVSHGGRYDGGVGYDHIYISTDYGLNYTTSALNFKRSDFKVSLCKPHNSGSVYCFVRRKSDSKLLIYKMSESDSDFSLFLETNQTLGGLDRAHGTLVDGNMHFYLSFNKKNIFYSSDEGVTWIQINANSGRDLEEIHPTQPNVCFKGFTDVNKSEDYGSTFSANSHTLGSNYVWDLQHMQTYDEEDGTNFTFIGLDFGSFYTNDSADWSTWVSVNRGSPTMMCYDIVSTDINNKIYTANQDRGSQGIIDDDGGDGLYDAFKEAPTDILRVTLAKNESSVWYWYYYGTIGRNDVVNGGGQSNIVKKDFYGSWWSTSMVASPNQNEDAIYVPTGNSLDKFTYNGNTIVKSTHPYNFGEAIISFSYSKLNTNRWYVGLKSGPFMYSTDGGNTFTQSSFAGTWPGQDNSYRKRKTVILASPIDENTVYFAGKGNRFLISNDGGVTFTNHSVGLSITRILAMDASPNGKYIFAATNNGPWVFSVEQDRWFKMTGEDVPEMIEWTDAQFIPSKNTIRFGTYGSGILDFKINENLLSTKLTDLNSEFLKVFPNPTEGVFEINVPKTLNNVTIELLSETGAVISKKEYTQTNGKVELNLENEASGLYFAKVYLDKPTTIKVLKK